MALSVGRPSRRKNEPGIFPAAYARSSMSTVRGKKSMPSRTPWDALAVTRTMVSPMRPTTAPWDWGASLPVSNDSDLSVPEIGPDTEMASAMLSPLWSGYRTVRDPAPTGRQRSQLSVVGHPDRRARVFGDWQLAAVAACLELLTQRRRPRRAISAR